MRILKTFLVSFYIINVMCDSEIQPHIILIVADDMGWNDVGFHGSNQIPTPNIDALAYNGIILNRFYTLPSCTPSRAALLTGQYPIRFGYQGLPLRWGEDRNLPFNISTLPRRLKSLGYATHLIGKWHLGFNYKNATPTGHGFDSHYGYWNGDMSYFDHDSEGSGMKGSDMHNNFKPLWETKGKYATHLFTEKAEELIWMHNESKPLFLMVSHLATHTGKHKKGGLEVPDTLKNDEEFSYIKDKNRRLYAGMVKELDDSVGSIIQTLSRKGILQNTIVVFVSDNGAPTKGVHLYNNHGSNWPFRGQKTTVLEGGVRTPAIIYSSRFKKNGIVSNSLIHISDLMPTLYKAAGGNIENLGKIDGINQWPIMTKKKKSPRTNLLINIDEVCNSSAIIGENGRYKLVNGSTSFLEVDEGFYGEDGRDDFNPPYNTSAILNSPVNQAILKSLTRRQVLRIRKKAALENCRKHLKKYHPCRYNNFCLFDLVKDPCETTNIANEFPLKVKKLERKLIKYWRNMLPQKKIFIDPRANPIYYNNTWYTWLEETDLSSSFKNNVRFYSNTI